MPGYEVTRVNREDFDTRNLESLFRCRRLLTTEFFERFRAAALGVDSPILHPAKLLVAEETRLAGTLPAIYALAAIQVESLEHALTEFTAVVAAYPLVQDALAH